MERLAGLAVTLALSAAPAAAETLTLTGVLTGADHQTYREIPFRVPAGTTAVTVAFAYDGKDQRSVIDLGIRDPQRFRGWSGGNKARFTLTETWATPSYLPGPLPTGGWRLILGAPNLRKDARAAYTATITLDRDPTFHGFAEAPLKTGPGWYRGDLHLHTGHSDGSCASRTGRRAPCPLFKTLDAAVARGLDFVAVTEHNTTSHFQAMAELQPAYDDLLLIPGREITTFQGHANVFGTTAPLDFQLGGPRAPDMGRILDQVAAAGGLLAINHPGLPSGEACMGCGWTAKTDFDRVPLIEVINGTISAGPLSGAPIWETQLNAGRRITAIGGSDNHDPTLTGARGVGTPTTVVWAETLSQDAILAGLRAGRVFVDVQGTTARRLDVTFEGDGQTVPMGGRATVPPGGGALRIHVVQAAGGKVRLAGPGAPALAEMSALSADQTVSIPVPPGAKGWVRADVVGPDGALWLLGNPIYLD